MAAQRFRRLGLQGIRRCGLVLVTVSAAACGGTDPAPPQRDAAPRPSDSTRPAERQLDAQRQAAPQPIPAPALLFWQRLQTLCGDAYAGGLTIGTEESDREIGYAELVMHVRYCDDAEVRIPFHVDDNRSRTWVLTLDGERLSLNHVHRNADGTEEAVTNYGGSIDAAGTAGRQEFPVSPDTVARLPATEGNVWAIEIEPGKGFAYELQRERDMRFFRVEFDLSETAAEPPPPWGAE
jgi:hypothetical protein